MSGKKLNKHSDVTAVYQQAITGTQRYLTNRTIVLNGKPVTSKAVVGIFQAQVDGIKAAVDAHVAWIQAVMKQRATAKAISGPLLAALRHFVAATFGVNGDEYRAFGFQPPKPRTTSPTTKVIAATKLRATRKARNTMGRKQRRAITGSVSSTIVLSTAGARTIGD